MERIEQEMEYKSTLTAGCDLVPTPRTQLEEKISFLENNYNEVEDIIKQLENVLARLIGHQPTEQCNNECQIDPTCIYDQLSLHKQRNEQQIIDLSSVTQRLLETV